MRRDAEHDAGDLPSGPLIVSCGRLSTQKAPDALVEASRVVCEAHPAAHFGWIGDGELRADVEAALDRDRLRDRWTVTGWLANPLPIIRRAAIFTLPSRYESFGYVTLEAMILGRAVVGSDVTGTRDLIRHGATGILVPPGDPAALARAIVELLEPPARAEALGAAAMRSAERYSVRRMAEETLGVHAEL